MLSDREGQLVARQGWLVDHDVALMAAFLGRPFLQGRWLGYLGDGEAFCCGWPLVGEPGMSGDEVRALSDALAALAVGKVHFWGPTAVDLPAVEPSWVPWYAAAPEEHDRLVQVKLATYDDAWVKKQSNYRRATRGTYTLAVSDCFPGPEVVQPLVEEYLARPELPELQKRFLSLALRGELYRGQVCVQAVLDRTVVGMIVCRTALENCWVACWGLVRKGHRGVSDFLNVQCLERARRAGTPCVDWGYGGTPSLLEYKVRLGANRLLGPVLRFGFRRSEAE